MINARIIRPRRCGYHYAKSQTFDESTPLSQPLLEVLPSLSSSPYFPFLGSPLLIVAGTGVGKTRSVLETVIPFALEHELSVCFISSRAAIGSQFKVSLARQLGLDEILQDYTPSGLRHLSEIGPVRVLTYHALWASMCANEAWIKEVDILIFDEIQALLLDAPFVSFTGQLMQRLPQAFAKAARIYMSATPKPILDVLFRTEGNERLQLLRWPTNYSAFCLHFFGGANSVVKKLNALPATERALVFLPSIAEGERMMGCITKTCRLISAKTKERDPEIWSQLLETQMLDRQVVLATTTLDAGVSLSDPALKHVFCTGLNAAAAIQQAGRKRLKTGEKLNVYLWSPKKDKLGFLLRQSKEITDALDLNKIEPYRFFRDYILEDTLPKIRKMCDTAKGPSPVVNSLAEEYFLQEQDLLLELLGEDSDYPLDQHWCDVFGQELPTDASRWLDDRYDATAKEALFSWLESQVGVTLEGKASKQSFGATFKSLYEKAFSARPNDRADRGWGLSVIKKTLVTLGGDFTVESAGGAWRICPTNRDSIKI